MRPKVMIALQQAESIPYRVEEAEIRRRFHAMMLLDRAASVNREKARTLVLTALDFHTRIGMHRLSELSRALPKKAADYYPAHWPGPWSRPRLAARLSISIISSVAGVNFRMASVRPDGHILCGGFSRLVSVRCSAGRVGSGN